MRTKTYCQVSFVKAKDCKESGGYRVYLYDRDGVKIQVGECYFYSGLNRSRMSLLKKILELS